MWGGNSMSLFEFIVKVAILVVLLAVCILQVKKTKKNIDKLEIEAYYEYLDNLEMLATVVYSVREAYALFLLENDHSIAKNKSQLVILSFARNLIISSVIIVLSRFFILADERHAILHLACDICFLAATIVLTSSQHSVRTLWS